jgi:acyl carrier protein
MMNMYPKDGTASDIATRVQVVIQDVLGLERAPPLDAKLGGDLIVSSMDAMTLVITLEDEFDQEIPNRDVADLGTVADVVAFVEKHLGNEC